MGRGGVAAGEIVQIIKKIHQALSGGTSRGCCPETSQVPYILEEMPTRNRLAGHLRSRSEFVTTWPQGLGENNQFCAIIF